MLKYEVAVLFGGVSNENEISVITGTLACNVLKKGGKSVLPMFLSQQGKLYAGEELADLNLFKDDGYVRSRTAVVCEGGVLLFNRRGKLKGKVSVGCALNCCHGGIAEGGAVAGLFGINRIAFASADLFESAAFIDKYYTKLVLKSLGVKVADYVYLRDIAGATEGAARLGYPVIVKPCRLGSSIGIAKAEDESSLLAAVSAAFMYDDGVLLEKYFADRREINCAAYFTADGVRTSLCEEPLVHGDLLSYDDKYSGNGRSVFPADLPEEQSEKIRQLTEYVYSSLHMRGIVRFDTILSDGEIYLSEINTVPGSLSYYLLSDGIPRFYAVLDEVIAQALRDFRRSEEKLLIHTGILNNFSSNACKIK